MHCSNLAADGVQRIITHPSNQSHVPHHLRVEDIHQRCIQPKSSQHSQVCTIQRRTQLRWVPLGHVPTPATVFTGGSNDPASSRMVSRTAAECFCPSAEIR